MTQSPVKRDVLLVVSLIYLLLPTAIFAVGWLIVPVAAVVLAAIVAVVADAWRRAVVEDRRQAIATTLTVVGLALFLTVVGGIGELNAQLSDYEKHNLLMRDLITRPWPVVYHQDSAHPALLCYYLAYYLPTALLGKLVGVHLAPAVSLVWGFVGVLISFAWVARLGRPHGGTVLALFLVIDGYTWLPALLKFAGAPAPFPDQDGGWNFGGRAYAFWQFGAARLPLPAQFELFNLAWTPQHALAAWIATACVLSVLVERADPRPLPVVHAATLLWSPFVTIGLLPFLAAAVLRDTRRALAWPSATAAAVITAPAALYMLGHGPVGDRTWLLAAFAGPTDWIRWVAFHIACVGVFWAALAWMRRRHGVPGGDWWLPFTIAVAVIPLASLYHLGHYNDWFLRVPMPAMVVVRLAVAVTAVRVWRAGIPRRHAAALALLVAIASLRSIKTYATALRGWGSVEHVPGIESADTYAPDIASMPGTATFDFAGQYLGRIDSLFAHTIMRHAGSGRSRHQLASSR